ncbi:hypothetical protein [Falsiroseomonas sp. CW058]|uniref:hypothetical protein n=1 Tax=Falsiroseomonas sp. CW058 TaxID=3388664 RepID=UPI003D3191A0
MSGHPVTVEGLAAEVRALRARVAELEGRLLRASAMLSGGGAQQQQQQQQPERPPWQQQQQRIEPAESWSLRPPGDVR